MTQQIINIGAAPNDGEGDNLRTAFDKVNENFSNVWAQGPVDSNVRIQGNTISTLQVNQDLALSPNGVGNVRLNNNTIPGANNTWFLGSTTNRWRGLYVGNVDAGNISISGSLAVPGDVTIGGNLTVEGDTIQIGNIVTDTKTIQLANTAATNAAANGSGITVGANDNIATFLYNSNTSSWVTNLPVTYANGQPIGKLPGGSNTQIQFNDGGNFGGDADLTYNKSTNTLALNGTLTALDATVYGQVAGVTGVFSGNVTANYFLGNGSQLTGIQTGAVISNTAPALSTGGIWWNSVDGRAYVKYANAFIDLSPSLVPDPTTYVGNVVFDNLTIENVGNVIPAGNNAYSLGSAAFQWKDLWVSNNTIYINSVPITLGAGNVLTVDGNDVVTTNSNGTVDLANLAIDNNNIYNSTGLGVVISNFSFIDEAETAYIQIPAGNSASDLNVVQEQGNVRLVANAASWTFDNTGNLTVPANGNVNGADGQFVRFQSVEEGVARSGMILNPGDGLTRLESWDNENFQSFTSADWSSATYVTGGSGGEIAFIDAPTILNFVNGIETSRLFLQVNDGAFMPYNGYGSSGNNITFDVTTAPADSPETVTSFVMAYSTRSRIEMDYDEGEMNLIARNLDININGDQSVDIQSSDRIRIENSSNVNSIYISTDTANAFRTWTFDPAGNLNLPLGGSISEGPSPSYLGDAVTITPANGGDPNQQLKIYPTVAEGNHLHLTSGNLAVTDLFLGDDRQYIRTTTTEGMTIGTGGGEIFGGYVWSFEENGNLIFPDGASIGSGAFTGTASSTVSLNAFSPDGNTVSFQAQGNSSSAVISIFSNAGPVTSNWTFTTAPLDPSESFLYVPNGGTISTPDATGGEGGKNIFIQAGASDPVTWNSNPGGELMLKGGYGSFGDGGGGPGGDVNIEGGPSSDSHAGNVNISSGLNTWVFDYTGNLTVPGNINGSDASPAPSINGFESVSAINVNASGNVTGGNFIGAGSNVDIVAGSYDWTFVNDGNLVLPGNTFAVKYANGTAVSLGGNYSDSNVVTLLGSFGSNTISTTGNITAGNLRTNNNLTFTANAGNIVFNNTAYISGNANALGRDGSIVLVPYTGAGSTFPGVVIGGAGRLIAPNGSVHQIFNTNDVTFQVPVKGTSTAATSTTTGALQLTGGAGIGGNIYVGGIANVTGNINGSGATFSGNVTAQNFIGNISITGNVQGTTANVQLVAGSYTATFDNTGVLTLPTIGGNEGGEINFGIPAANTTLIGPVKVDVFQDRVRFFDGSTKGAYIDLSQAAAGVGSLLNNRVSAVVDAGTFVTMDNIKATVTGSAPRGLSLATVSGSFTYDIGGTFAGFGVGNGGTSLGGQTLTTTPTSSIFGWGFTNQGDIATYIITNISSMLAYRITLQIGGSFLNNRIVIERLI